MSTKLKQETVGSIILSRSSIATALVLSAV